MTCREVKFEQSVPKVFAPLGVPSRYKGAHGGRGSSKSWFFGGRLILDHITNPGLSSVSLREVQKDLKSSAKKLVENLLTRYKLGEAQGFKVFNDRIKTPGDGVIIFQGLQDHTAESVKSLEDFGRAWVEEAQTVSATSLNLLRPTIRSPGSELWFSWNPRRKSDPVDVMLRGEEVPTGSIVVRANWNDNPFFTDELEQERLDCLRMQPDQYPHIWDGEYITVNSSAYYAKEITLAMQENRIGGNVPIDPLMTVRAFWDIGGTGAKADAVAIWIAQFIGKEIRVIDYYETVGQPLAFHLNWLRTNGYDGCLCVLPHDGAQHDKIESITYEGAIKKAGFQTKIIKNQGTGAAMQRVESVRRLFPAMWFDKKCEAGVDALSWFHERKDDKRNIGLGPEHDWSSHGCDAAGLLAIAYEELVKEKTKRNVVLPRYTSLTPGMGY